MDKRILSNLTLVTGVPSTLMQCKVTATDSITAGVLSKVDWGLVGDDKDLHSVALFLQRWIRGLWGRAYAKEYARQVREQRKRRRLQRQAAATR